MPRFGEFEALRIVAPGATGAIHAARPVGSTDEPSFAVRVFLPDVLVVGEEEAALQSELFIARAESLARVGTAVAAAVPAGFGAPAIWAPVYDIGRLPDSPGGFFITDLAWPAQPSLAHVWRARVVLDHVALGAVVGKIVHALRLGRTHAARTHGRLDDSAVLLLSPGDLAHARIALTDPASDDNAPELDDLRALGRIIFSLVQHQRPESILRVSDDRPWTAALGKDAPRWIELVNTLLDPSDTAPRPTIDELDMLLAPLRDGSQRRPDARTLTGTRSDIRTPLPPTLSGVPKGVDWNGTRTRMLPAVGSLPSGHTHPGRAPVSAVGLSGAAPALQRGPVYASSPIATPPVIPTPIQRPSPSNTQNAATATSGQSPPVVLTTPITPGTPTGSLVPPNQTGSTATDRGLLKEWSAAAAASAEAQRTPRSKPLLIGAGVLVAATIGIAAWTLTRPNAPSPSPSPTPTQNPLTHVTPPSITTPSTTNDQPSVEPSPKTPPTVATLPRSDARALADQSLPKPKVFDRQLPDWAIALLGVLDEERRRAIDELLRKSAKGSGEDVVQSLLEEHISEHTARLRERFARADAALVDLLIASDALDDAYPVNLDEAAPGTTPWRAHTSELDAEPTWNVAIAPLRSRIDALTAARSAADPRTLIAQLATPTSTTTAALAAETLARLRTVPTWPASSADLATFAQARTHAATFFDRVPSQPRRAKLQGELAEFARQAWTRAASSVTDPDEFTRVLGARAGLSVPDEALTGPLKLRARVAALHAQLPQASTPALLAALLAAFDTDTKSLAPAPEQAQAIASTTAPLRELANKPPAPAVLPEGPQSPGLAVKATGGVGGQIASFQVGQQSFDFQRVRANDRDVFVCVREMSVGDVIAILEASGKAAEFRELSGLSADDETQIDWLGPRSWSWSGRTILRNTDWIVIPGFADDPAYSPGLTKPKPPSIASPMNAISAQAAGYLASLMGCRFPTTAEWAAARAIAPTTNPVLWNAQCDALLNYHVSTKGWGPQFGQTFRRSRDPMQAAASGSFLWFRGGPDSPDTIKDLVGNVAEFVCDKPGLAQARTPDAVRALLSQAISERALGVIGGSRLWPAGESVDQPAWLADQPADQQTSSDAFSDVGFRLAFSAPAAAATDTITAQVLSIRAAMKLP